MEWKIYTMVIDGGLNKIVLKILGKTKFEKKQKIEKTKKQKNKKIEKTTKNAKSKFKDPIPSKFPPHQPNTNPLIKFICITLYLSKYLNYGHFHNNSQFWTVLFPPPNLILFKVFSTTIPSLYSFTDFILDISLYGWPYHHYYPYLE